MITHQMLSVHTAPEEFSKCNNRLSFRMCLRIIRSGKSRDDRDVIVLENAFRPHENQKSAYSNSFRLKGVFEKLRFRDGLVWMIGLTVETKLRFQISPAWCRPGRVDSHINRV